MPKVPATVVTCLLAVAAAAQNGPGPTPGQGPARIPSGYPTRNVLSPFRKCDEVCAPPDALFEQLRIMRGIAERLADKRDFDKYGREVVDDPTWAAAHAKVEHLGIDAGHLAQIVRTSRVADDRDVAFYGAFFCTDVDHVFNLIGHIPGEPSPVIREHAFPRAVAYLKAHLNIRFGDLTPEQQKELAGPEPGSPAARAAGITRRPVATDWLFGARLNLQPFLQLLDQESESDQAQALWFLKETFQARRDLAEYWLEPTLPRIEQLLTGGPRRLREEAIGLLHAIAKPGTVAAAAGETEDRLLAWAKECERAVFPPLRRLGESTFLLFPSPERDAIVKAGREALAGNSIGDAVHGRTAAGANYFGFRIGRVPDELKDLRLPVGAIVTAVNGVPVSDGKSLLAALDKQLAPTARPLKVVVEFLVDEQSRANEYRIQ